MKRPTLDTVTNIAIILASAALIAKSFGMLDTVARPAAPAAGSGIPKYAVGDRLPPIVGLSLAGRDRTLVLSLSSHCRYCEEAMPFFQTVVSRRKDSRAQVVVLSRDSPSDLAAYLSKHHLTPDAAASIQTRTDIKLNMTPTILLLDQAGMVQRIWTGVSKDTVREEIIHAIE